jgi:hypothetical protein
MRLRAIVAVLAFLSAATAAAAVEPMTIDWGGLRLEVSTSRTAQVFHIVDQLSEWDQFTHKQYGRWARKSMLLDETDRALLRQHAEMRRRRGWEHGFEQAFYTKGTLEAAVGRAEADGLLTADEAAHEGSILRHFDGKLREVLDTHAGSIDLFAKRLQREAETMRPFITKLCRFAELKETAIVPVFLVANPEEGSGGGGAHGTRVVVEVQQRPDPLPFVIHEALHALLDPHRIEITAAAASAGLTWQELNEGIAYALAPGLTDDVTDADTLAEAWARKTIGGASSTDSFVRFYMIATVLRPVLRSALDNGETLTTFLPLAVAKWRAVAPR